MVQFLLDEDVDPNNGGFRGQTPLSLATHDGNGVVVGLLLASKRIQPYTSDADGRALLWWAAKLAILLQLECSLISRVLIFSQKTTTV